MTPSQLSMLAWSGGGLAGAALSSEHRIAGGALGALLVGTMSDVVIERYQRRLPVAGAVVTGLGIVGLTFLLLSRSKR